MKRKTEITIETERLVVIRAKETIHELPIQTPEEDETRDKTRPEEKASTAET